MARTDLDTLKVPRGFRSREAGRFVAQLDDLSGRMRKQTRGMSAAELGWQPEPGMNTAGMLLAHIAIVEVYWTEIGPLRQEAGDCKAVLGIGLDDDGMPLAAVGKPPRKLEGKSLAFYDRLFARARAHTYQVTRTLRDPDLDHVVKRKRRDGRIDAEDVRWILYHMVEHMAGHYGQILMLRHLHRARGA